MHFDDFELYVMSQALLQTVKNNPEWQEEMAVEYDTGEEFWHELNRKCRRMADKHG